MGARRAELAYNFLNFDKMTIFVLILDFCTLCCCNINIFINSGNSNRNILTNQSIKSISQ